MFFSLGNFGLNSDFVERLLAKDCASLEVGVEGLVGLHGSEPFRASAIL